MRVYDDSRRYYVYVYYENDTQKPFYVGKGTGNRYLNIENRGVYFKRKLNKHGGVVEIIFDNLSEKEAYEAEIWTIYEYKHILNYDLVNLTDGGDDPPSYSGGDSPKASSVVLVNTGEKFLTLKEASEKYGVDFKGISACARHKSKFAGKMPNGDAMIWRYEEEYSPEEEFDFKIANPVAVSKKVMCVTTNEVFESAAKAGEKYNTSRKHISAVCRGKRKTSGKLGDGTKLVWKFID